MAKFTLDYEQLKAMQATLQDMQESGRDVPSWMEDLMAPLSGGGRGPLDPALLADRSQWGEFGARFGGAGAGSKRDLAKILARVPGVELGAFRRGLPSEEAQSLFDELTASRQAVYARSQEMYGLDVESFDILHARARGSRASVDWVRLATGKESAVKAGKNQLILGVAGKAMQEYGIETRAMKGVPGGHIAGSESYWEARGNAAQEDINARNVGDIRVPAGLVRETAFQAVVEATGVHLGKDQEPGPRQGRRGDLFFDVDKLSRIPGNVVDESGNIHAPFQEKRLLGGAKSNRIGVTGVPTVLSLGRAAQGNMAEYVTPTTAYVSIGTFLQEGQALYNPNVLGRPVSMINRSVTLREGEKPLIKLGDVFSGSERIVPVPGHAGLRFNPNYEQLEVVSIGEVTRVGPGGTFQELEMQFRGIQHSNPIQLKGAGSKGDAPPNANLLDQLGVGAMIQPNQMTQFAISSLIPAMYREDKERLAGILGDLMPAEDDRGGIYPTRAMGERFTEWVSQNVEERRMPRQAYNWFDPTVRVKVETGQIDPESMQWVNKNSGVFTAVEKDIGIVLPVDLHMQEVWNWIRQSYGPDALEQFARMDPRQVEHFFRQHLGDNMHAVNVLQAALTSEGVDIPGTQAFRERAIAVEDIDWQRATDLASKQLIAQGVDIDDESNSGLLRIEMLRQVGKLYPGRGVAVGKGEDRYYLPNPASALVFGQGSRLDTPIGFTRIVTDTLLAQHEQSQGIFKIPPWFYAAAEEAKGGPLTAEEIEDLHPAYNEYLKKSYQEGIAEGVGADFLKRNILSLNVPTKVGGQIVSVSGMPLNRFVIGREGLSKLVDAKVKDPETGKLRNATPEEKEALLNQIEAGEVAGPVATLGREPKISPQSAGSNLLYMSPAEAVKLGLFKEKEDIEMMARGGGVASTTMAAQGGDEDRDPYDITGKGEMVLQNGRWRRRGAPRVTSNQKLAYYAQHNPAAEVSKRIDKIKRRWDKEGAAIDMLARSKYAEYTPEQFAEATREEVAAKSYIGRSYNTFGRRFSALMEGVPAGNAEEFLRGHQQALDMELFARTNQDPEELAWAEPWRDLIALSESYGADLGGYRTAGGKGGWNDPGVGGTGFTTLNERIIKDVLNLRHNEDTLLSVETRAAALINPGKDEESYNKLLGLINRHDTEYDKLSRAGRFDLDREIRELVWPTGTPFDDIAESRPVLGSVVATGIERAREKGAMSEGGRTTKTERGLRVNKYVPGSDVQETMSMGRSIVGVVRALTADNGLTIGQRVANLSHLYNEGKLFPMMRAMFGVLQEAMGRPSGKAPAPPAPLVSSSMKKPSYSPAELRRKAPGGPAPQGESPPMDTTREPVDPENEHIAQTAANDPTTVMPVGGGEGAINIRASSLGSTANQLLLDRIREGKPFGIPGQEEAPEALSRGTAVHAVMEGLARRVSAGGKFSHGGKNWTVGYENALSRSYKLGDQAINLSGHPDIFLFDEESGELRILDYKTGKASYGMDKYAAQVTGYAALLAPQLNPTSVSGTIVPLDADSSIVQEAAALMTDEEIDAVKDPEARELIRDWRAETIVANSLAGKPNADPNALMTDVLGHAEQSGIQVDMEDYEAQNAQNIQARVEEGRIADEATAAIKGRMAESPEARESIAEDLINIQQNPHYGTQLALAERAIQGLKSGEPMPTSSAARPAGPPPSPEEQGIPPEPGTLPAPAAAGGGSGNLPPGGPPVANDFPDPEPERKPDSGWQEVGTTRMETSMSRRYKYQKTGAKVRLSNGQQGTILSQPASLRSGDEVQVELDDGSIGIYRRDQIGPVSSTTSQEPASGGRTGMLRWLEPGKLPPSSGSAQLPSGGGGGGGGKPRKPAGLVNTGDLTEQQAKQQVAVALENVHSVTGKSVMGRLIAGGEPGDPFRVAVFDINAATQLNEEQSEKRLDFLRKIASGGFEKSAEGLVTAIQEGRAVGISGAIVESLLGDKPLTGAQTESLVKLMEPEHLDVALEQELFDPGGYLEGKGKRRGVFETLSKGTPTREEVLTALANHQITQREAASLFYKIQGGTELPKGVSKALSYTHTASLAETDKGVVVQNALDMINEQGGGATGFSLGAMQSTDFAHAYMEATDMGLSGGAAKAAAKHVSGQAPTESEASAYLLQTRNVDDYEAMMQNVTRKGGGDDVDTLREKFEKLGVTTEKLNKLFEDSTGSVKGMQQAIDKVNKAVESGDKKAVSEALDELATLSKKEAGLSELAGAAKRGAWGADRTEAMLGAVTAEEGPPPTSFLGRLGAKLEANQPAGKGIFAGDLGQMGWALFNVQRAWRYTGGVVSGLMGDYAGQIGAEQQAAASLGMGSGYSGPASSILAGQAAMGRLKLGLGESAWDTWGWIPEALGNLDAGGESTFLGRGASLAAGLGGSMISTGLAANAAARLRMPKMAGALTLAGGALGKAVPIIAAGWLAKEVGSAAAYGFSQTPLARNMGAPEYESADDAWQSVLKSVSVLSAAPVAVPLGFAAKFAGFPGVAGAMGNVLDWANRGGLAMELGWVDKEQERSPQQELYHQTVLDLSKAAGVDPSVANQTVATYAQMTGRNPDQWTDMDRERAKSFAKLAPGVREQTMQGAAGYATALGLRYGQGEAEPMPGFVASGTFGPGDSYAAATMRYSQYTPAQQAAMAPAINTMADIQQRYRAETGVYLPASQEQIEAMGPEVASLMTRFGAGDQTAWSALGQLIGDSRLVTTNPVTGMPVGSNWGGGYLAENILSGHVNVGARIEDVFRNADIDFETMQKPAEAIALFGAEGSATFEAAGGGVSIPSVPGITRDNIEGSKAVIINTGEATVNVGGHKVPLTMQDLSDHATFLQREDRWAQFGEQQIGLAAQIAVTTGERPDWAPAGTPTFGASIWGLEDQMTALQHQHQQTGFGFQWQQLEMSNRQFYENWNRSRGRTEAQFGWQAQDRGQAYQRQMTQFGWAEEDLAYQGAQSTLHYAWNMEDIQENLRYATGRDRRKLMKQQDRATIDYAMGMGRLDTEDERLDTRREWAEEDFQKEEERHTLRQQWAREDLDLQRRHHEESTELARARLQENQLYYEETFKLQEEQKDLSRTYWEFQTSQQVGAMERAIELEKNLETVQDLMTGLARSQEETISWFNQQFKPGGGLRTAWSGFIIQMQSDLNGLKRIADVLVRGNLWPN